MKVFTFAAPASTPVEFLYPLRSGDCDPSFQPLIEHANWQEVDSIQDCDIAIFPRKAFEPRTLKFDPTVFRAAELAAAAGKPIIIDATSDSDVPLDIPTATVLRFGLYRSLVKHFEIERPYWTEQKRKEELEVLPIRPRSSKPIVGFCGSTASAGNWFKVGRNLPFKLSRALLAHSICARSLDSRLKKGMSHCLREMSMQLLEKESRIDCRFEIISPLVEYYSTAPANQRKQEDLFTQVMDQCDYALCVRGVGNYSSRFYMALNSGRIPLVVDTDHVFPCEGRIHMVRVPVNQLENIGNYVLNHFESLTDAELMEMKQENRAIYNQMMAPDRYIPRIMELALNRRVVPEITIGQQLPA